jgi:CRP-like cAMP-binding protein
MTEVVSQHPIMNAGLGPQGQFLLREADRSLPGLWEAAQFCLTPPRKRSEAACREFASQFVAKHRSKLGILGTLSWRVLEQLTRVIEVEVKPEGSVLYRQGEKGTVMHILVHGQVSVYATSSPKAGSRHRPRAAPATEASAMMTLRCSEDVQAAHEELVWAKEWSMGVPSAAESCNIRKVGETNQAAIRQMNTLEIAPPLRLRRADDVHRTVQNISSLRLVPTTAPARPAHGSSPTNTSGVLFEIDRARPRSQRQCLVPTLASLQAWAASPASGSLVALSNSGRSSHARETVEYGDWLAEIRPPRSFGEVALRSPSHRRSATVVTDTPIVAFRVRLEDVVKNATLTPVLATNTDVFLFLSKQRWMKPAPLRFATALAYSLRKVFLHTGTVVLREGETSPLLYIVRSGVCQMSVAIDTSKVRERLAIAQSAGLPLNPHGASRALGLTFRLGAVGPGSVFGERPCLLGLPEELTYTTKGEVELLEIPRELLIPVMPYITEPLLCELAAKDRLHASSLLQVARLESSSLKRALGVSRHVFDSEDTKEVSSLPRALVTDASLTFTVSKSMVRQCSPMTKRAALSPSFLTSSKRGGALPEIVPRKTLPDVERPRTGASWRGPQSVLPRATDADPALLFRHHRTNTSEPERPKTSDCVALRPKAKSLGRVAKPSLLHPSVVQSLGVLRSMDRTLASTPVYWRGLED